LIGALLAPGTWPAIFVRQGEGFRPTGCFDRPSGFTQRAPGRLWESVKVLQRLKRAEMTPRRVKALYYLVMRIPMRINGMIYSEWFDDAPPVDRF